MRRLTWSDFREVQKPAPGPGEFVTAAETKTDVPPVSFNLRPVPGSTPARFRLEDTITVRIVFDAARCWRADWVKTRPQADQDRLLQHEQGHYNISALIGRDFFVGLMQLKANKYAALPAFRRGLGDLEANTLAKTQAVQDKYDADTKSGSDWPAQNRWNAVINTAFTSPRTPPVTAADGGSLKVTLLDALRGAGIAP